MDPKTTTPATPNGAMIPWPVALTGSLILLSVVLAFIVFAMRHRPHATYNQAGANWTQIFDRRPGDLRYRTEDMDKLIKASTVARAPTPVVKAMEQKLQGGLKRESSR